MIPRNPTKSLWRAVLALAPFSAVSKIYFSFVWPALALDILFIALILVCVLEQRAHSRLYFMMSLSLIAITVAEFFNPHLIPLQTAMQGYRLTGLYTWALLIPVFVRFSERDYRSMRHILLALAIFSTLNALRQFAIPLSSEIAYADLSGGASKLLGDAFQGSTNSFRPFSTFVTSVHLALYLTLPLFLAVAHWRKVQGRAAASLIAIGIAITLSRTAYVSIIATVVILALSAISVGRLRVSKAIVVGIVLLLPLGVLVANSDLIAARIGTLSDPSSVSSFQTRLNLWAFRIIEILDNPWGFGTGAASWAFKDSLNLGADSGYLKLFLEFGWLGGGVFVVFFLFLASKCIQLQRAVFRFDSRTGGSESSFFAVASSGLIIANLVQMITSQTLEAYPNNLMFWFCAGVVCTYRDRLSQSNGPVQTRSRHRLPAATGAHSARHYCLR